MDAKGLDSVEGINSDDENSLEREAEQRVLDLEAADLLKYPQMFDARRLVKSPNVVVAILKALLAILKLPNANSLPTSDELIDMFLLIFEADMVTLSFDKEDKCCGPCGPCRSLLVLRLAEAVLYEVLLRVIEAHESLEYLQVTLKSMRILTLSGLSRLYKRYTTKLKQILVKHQFSMFQFDELYYVHESDPVLHPLVPVNRNNDEESMMRRRKAMFSRVHYRDPNVYFLGYMGPPSDSNFDCLYAVIDIERQRQFHNFEPAMITAVKDDFAEDLGDEVKFKESDDFSG